MAAYDIENSALLQVIELPTKKNVLQVRTVDRVKIYALTEC